MKELRFKGKEQRDADLAARAKKLEALKAEKAWLEGLVAGANEDDLSLAAGLTPIHTPNRKEPHPADWYQLQFSSIVEIEKQIDELEAQDAPASDT